MAMLNESFSNSKENTSNISFTIEKHLKHGRHLSKYKFQDDSTDITLPNDETYIGIDFIKDLNDYLKKMNLGEVEYSTFQYQAKSKQPAYIANIKLGNTSLASSFPEKYSVPEVAKQVTARKALAVLKKKYETENTSVTNDMTVVVERLEKELKKTKNYAGLFCESMEDIYKEEYNESLPLNWLVNLKKLSTNIIVEEIPNQNKSILYHAPLSESKNDEESTNTSLIETYNLPLMNFEDKTEKTVDLTCIDNDHTLWICFVNDSRNVDYNTMFNLMNLPDEYKHFSKMFDIEVLDFYAVKANGVWYRFQVTKIENDLTTGIFIDLGIEWKLPTSSVMYLPQKFLKVPSQAIKCALTSLYFAPYFKIALDIFNKLLIEKQFTVIPDDIECVVPLVTLYSGKQNINTLLMEAITEKTKFTKIDETCKKVSLSYIGDGYMYLHPQNETLLVLESILDTISLSHPVDQLYCKSSISPNKIYLVQCTELNIWCRAKIEDFIFINHQFKVYFIDYGNYGLIDEDKFIELEKIDLFLVKICPQALKVSVHLFPPEKLTESPSRALHEMIQDTPLDVEVVSTDSNGLQIVELYDANDQTGNCVSFNMQLYQSA